MIPFRNLRRFARKAFEQPLYAVKVATRRLHAHRFYRSANGTAPAPEAVTIFLTHKCNLRCRMCGQWGDKGITRTDAADSLREELSFEEMKKLIDDLARIGANITLFGGEPFMYRDILPLIRYIKSRGLHCLVITNGSLLKPLAEEIVRSGLDELNLSLDGAEPTHDAIRGMNGLFRRIADGVQEIDAFKEKLGTKKPLINLQCTINKDNYRSIDEMLEVGKALKVNSLTYHHLIFLSNGIYEKQEQHLAEILGDARSTDWKGFIFEPGINVPSLIDRIGAIKKQRPGFFVNFYPNFSDAELLKYYGDPEYVPEGYRPRCLSPWIVTYIFPDGNVGPCLNVDYSFGNIKEASFMDIWNSAPAIRYRSALQKDRLFPACIRCTELYRY
jgi:MoaA/NifB/PqqE/SkfB family radical SAM enzyme